MSNGLSIVRRFVSPEGTPVDIARLTRGEMVFAEIAITSSDVRHVGVSVEAMYYPSLNARSAPQRLSVR